MSEYQYYEFQAVDWPLTEREMRALRGYSTRADITPTRFVNHYEWGDFKGDPVAWVERYFDAFLYLANWGTRELMLRLPRRVLDLETAQRHLVGEAALSAREGRPRHSRVLLGQRRWRWVGRRRQRMVVIPDSPSRGRRGRRLADALPGVASLRPERRGSRGRAGAARPRGSGLAHGVAPGIRGLPSHRRRFDCDRRRA